MERWELLQQSLVLVFSEALLKAPSELLRRPRCYQKKLLFRLLLLLPGGSLRLYRYLLGLALWG